MNSFFLDGSALAKRYVAEQGTPVVDYLFDKLVRRRNAGVFSVTTFSQGLTRLGQEVIHATTLRKVEASNALVIAA